MCHRFGPVRVQARTPPSFLTNHSRAMGAGNKRSHSARIPRSRRAPPLLLELAARSTFPRGLYGCKTENNKKHYPIHSTRRADGKPVSVCDRQNKINPQISEQCRRQCFRRSLYVYSFCPSCSVTTTVMAAAARFFIRGANAKLSTAGVVTGAHSGYRTALLKLSPSCSSRTKTPRRHAAHFTYHPDPVPTQYGEWSPAG